MWRHTVSLSLPNAERSRGRSDTLSGERLVETSAAHHTVKSTTTAAVSLGAVLQGGDSVVSRQSFRKRGHRHDTVRFGEPRGQRLLCWVVFEHAACLPYGALPSPLRIGAAITVVADAASVGSDADSIATMRQ